MTTTEKNLVPWISAADESLSLENSYDLYLIIGTDLIQFTLIDNDRNKFVALHDYNIAGIKPEDFNDRIEATLLGDELIGKYKNNFRKVVISLMGNRSTIVPNAFYDDSKKNEIFAFNHELNSEEVLMADKVRQIDSTLLFTASKSMINFLNQFFNDKVYHNACNSLIEGIFLQHKNHEEKIVSVNVSHTFFDLIITEGKKLHYHNSFSYHSTEDFIYYILFACEQLQLNPETTHFYFSGMIEKNSALYLLAQKYVRHLHFTQRPDFCDYAYRLNEVPQHYHYQLYNQFLCVL
jgi:Protein of unknown function (DUF3822)